VHTVSVRLSAVDLGLYKRLLAQHGGGSVHESDRFRNMLHKLVVPLRLVTPLESHVEETEEEREEREQYEIWFKSLGE